MQDKYSEEYDLNTIPIRVNKTIKEVLDLYILIKIPYKVLMSDYLALIGNSNTREADNPWEYHYKGIEKQEIECGVSKLETAFMVGAMKLIEQKPTDVINAAFYKTRNDSAFECGFLLDQFRGVQGIRRITEVATEMVATPYTLFNFNTTPVTTEYAALSAVVSEYYPILRDGFAEDVNTTKYMLLRAVV